MTTVDSHMGSNSQHRLSDQVSANTRQAIEAAGAVLLYLPPYSPDLNPIEQLFANLTSPIRALWGT